MQIRFSIASFKFLTSKTNSENMFWNNKTEEEIFKSVKAKPETFKEKDKVDSTLEGAMVKINKITEQINLMSRYLSYLSEKFDKTIDSAIAYDKTLDEIESRINLLRAKIDDLDSVSSPSVKMGERNKAI